MRWKVKCLLDEKGQVRVEKEGGREEREVERKVEERKGENTIGKKRRGWHRYKDGR